MNHNELRSTHGLDPVLASAPTGAFAEAPPKKERGVPLATGAILQELSGDMVLFGAGYPRREAFDNSCAYGVGLLSNLPRMWRPGLN